MQTKSSVFTESVRMCKISEYYTLMNQLEKILTSMEKSGFQDVPLGGSEGCILIKLDHGIHNNLKAM